MAPYTAHAPHFLTPVDAVAEPVALAALVDHPPLGAVLLNGGPGRPGAPPWRPEEVGAVLEVEEGVARRGPVAAVVTARCKSDRAEIIIECKVWHCHHTNAVGLGGFL